MKIMGVKEDTDYKVTIESHVIETIPFETRETYDSTIYEGTKYIDQKGEEGAVSETYIVLTKDGNLVSRTHISTDTYSPLSEIIRIGTKEDTYTETYHELRNEIIKNYTEDN